MVVMLQSNYQGVGEARERQKRIKDRREIGAKECNKKVAETKE
jgi:hypothetical protein